MQLNSALAFPHPTHPEELREISDSRSGRPTALQDFLASSASDAQKKTPLPHRHASSREENVSMRKPVSSCLGIYGWECGANDPFLHTLQIHPSFCRTAQGCQVLLSDHRSSSGCRKDWSTDQKLHAITRARLVLAGHTVNRRRDSSHGCI